MIIRLEPDEEEILRLVYRAGKLLLRGILSITNPKQMEVIGKKRYENIPVPIFRTLEKDGYIKEIESGNMRYGSVYITQKGRDYCEDHKLK